MSKLLITAQEVIDIAIESKNFNPEKIKDSKIEAAQEDNIRPVLGKELYDELVNQFDNNQVSEKNAKILSIVKIALAYFVVSRIAPNIMLQLTNKGGQQPMTENSQPISNQQRMQFQQQAIDDGNSFLRKLTRYIEENETDYPLYFKINNVKNRVKNRGGIILTR